jgi:peroxisomal membrane protein 4
VNLAWFVGGYKSLVGLLEGDPLHCAHCAPTLTARKGPGNSRKPWKNFLAAFIMGYYVFGENNNVNSQVCVRDALCLIVSNSGRGQINMYLLSRILFGLARLAVSSGVISAPKGGRIMCTAEGAHACGYAADTFPLFAALVWGTVLWLFEYHRCAGYPNVARCLVRSD